MAINYLGTGLAVVTCGLETGMDLPDLASVIETDTLGGENGTYHEATEAEVQLGVAFGAASALTGTYAPGDAPPTTPNFTLTDCETGDSFTINVTCDAVTTNAIYRWTGSAWGLMEFSAGGDAEFVGTGAEQTFTIAATTGWYVVMVLSTSGGSSCAAAPIRVTDSDEKTGYYKVVEIRSNPSTGKKDVIVEKIQRPTFPR